MKVNVNRDTRAGKNGRIIYCPKCNKGLKVYHFSWSSITCIECGKKSEKDEFKTDKK